jgi:hypothetical protein
MTQAQKIAKLIEVMKIITLSIAQNNREKQLEHVKTANQLLKELE